MYDRALEAGKNTMLGLLEGINSMTPLVNAAYAAVAGYNAEMSGVVNMAPQRESEAAVGVAAMQQIGADIVNGVQTAMAGNAGGGIHTAVLQLPDGNELARYYLPSFIDTGRENGTPIQNNVLGGGA